MSLTGAAFLLAFAAGLWFTVFRHPLFGLYSYIALFYLNPVSRWWGETLPDLRWSLVMGVVTLIVTDLPVSRQTHSSSGYSILTASAGR